MSPELALIFPPVWYYSAVPADLSYPAGSLRAAGVHVRLLDLNSRLHQALLGDLAGPLRDPATYADPRAHAAATARMLDRVGSISARLGVSYSMRQLQFPGLDLSDLVAAQAAGLCARNPALPLLRQTASALVADPPGAIAVALVHPDQIPQVLALGALLRAAGLQRPLVLYGALEDVLSPLDLAPDLVGDPPHLLFQTFDAVILGEGEAPLLALSQVAAGARTLDQAPLLRPGGQIPEVPALDLGAHPGPDWAGLDPAPLAPAPVVDLRLGRGCPWARCTFCAIQAHQEGYQAGTAAALADAMSRAHDQLGSVFFRVRDDLLTPRQLVEVGAAVGALPFEARWSARARLETTLTRTALKAAAMGGLDELWLGLESASERVRARMDKGVRTEDVDRILVSAHAAGVRVRLLCMVGYPGETLEEAQSTLQFLRDRASLLAGFSLTPFQLMRRSPLGRDPGRAGLRLTDDPLPRERRLRWRLPCAGDLLPPAEIAALIETAYADVLPRFPPVLGPDLHHDWMAASVARRGWPDSEP